MAIDIEWQMLPGQNDGNDSQPQLYPRMVENGTVDLQLLCERIAKYGSHTKGTVISVMSDMMDVVAELLREGKTVDFEELGTFKLSIGTEQAVALDTPFHKRRVTVRGVNFQPHKALMKAIGTPCFCSVPRSASPLTMTTGQLQQVLLEYFKTHDSITRSQLEALCKLKRSTACVRLNELVKSGFLRKVGHNRETKYEMMCR